MSVALESMDGTRLVFDSGTECEITLHCGHTVRGDASTELNPTGHSMRCKVCGGEWRLVVHAEPIFGLNLAKSTYTPTPPKKEKRHYGKYGKRKPAKPKEKRKIPAAKIVKRAR